MFCIGSAQRCGTAPRIRTLRASRKGGVLDRESHRRHRRTYSVGTLLALAFSPADTALAARKLVTKHSGRIGVFRRCNRRTFSAVRLVRATSDKSRYLSTLPDSIRPEVSHALQRSITQACVHFREFAFQCTTLARAPIPRGLSPQISAGCIRTASLCARCDVILDARFEMRPAEAIAV